LAYKVGRCLLRELLHDAKMEQTDLARKLNVTPPQINKYVNDKQRMSLQVAKNIASIFNCQIEDLYEWHKVGENE
jgi:DNA-binding XRE family transcriptional regulator